jgi:hypothetical protein
LKGGRVEVDATGEEDVGESTNGLEEEEEAVPLRFGRCGFGARVK